MELTFAAAGRESVLSINKLVLRSVVQQAVLLMHAYSAMSKCVAELAPRYRAVCRVEVAVAKPLHLVLLPLCCCG